MDNKLTEPRRLTLRQIAVYRDRVANVEFRIIAAPPAKVEQPK